MTRRAPADRRSWGSSNSSPPATTTGGLRCGVQGPGRTATARAAGAAAGDRRGAGPAGGTSAPDRRTLQPASGWKLDGFRRGAAPCLVHLKSQPGDAAPPLATASVPELKASAYLGAAGRQIRVLRQSAYPPDSRPTEGPTVILLHPPAARQRHSVAWLTTSPGTPSFSHPICPGTAPAIHRRRRWNRAPRWMGVSRNWQQP